LVLGPKKRFITVGSSKNIFLTVNPLTVNNLYFYLQDIEKSFSYSLLAVASFVTLKKNFKLFLVYRLGDWLKKGYMKHIVLNIWWFLLTIKKIINLYHA
jgi:hypothetical protein